MFPAEEASAAPPPTIGGYTPYPCRLFYPLSSRNTKNARRLQASTSSSLGPVFGPSPRSGLDAPSSDDAQHTNIGAIVGAAVVSGVVVVVALAALYLWWFKKSQRKASMASINDQHDASPELRNTFKGTSICMY